MDLITTKRVLDEKCRTIEQLKSIIDELKFRHEKKEHELIKHIGLLYNDLQQNKKKMAHLILKYQQQKKVYKHRYKCLYYYVVIEKLYKCILIDFINKLFIYS
jgi:hypothetical protein